MDTSDKFIFFSLFFSARKYANNAPAPAIIIFSFFFIFAHFKIFYNYNADDRQQKYQTGKQLLGKTKTHHEISHTEYRQK